MIRPFAAPRETERAWRDRLHRFQRLRAWPRAPGTA